MQKHNGQVFLNIAHAVIDLPVSGRLTNKIEISVHDLVRVNYCHLSK